jgi:hypothetical protein
LIARQLAPGETNDLVAQNSKAGLPGAVLLEGGPASMRIPAVDFDDEAFVAPEIVDLVSSNPDIDLGLGKAVATAEGEHAVLELRSRAVGFGLITDRQAQELSLAEGGGELGWGKETTQVGERARGIGHRDAVTAGAATGTERGGTVEDDAAPLSFPRGTRDADVHWSESGVPGFG